MHEAGIAQDLLSSIQKEIKDNSSSARVKKIHIRLGRSMGITGDSLRFWFENVSRGTPLESALLEVTLVDGRGVFLDSLEVE